MIQNHKYIAFIYCVKFLSLFLGFYYFSIAFNGIVSPEGGLYSAFLDHYLNYIAWIRESNIYVSNVMTNALGTRSFISGPQMINIAGGTEVEIWLPCLGFGIMSFWGAFVIVNAGTLKRKLLWAFAGIFAIWFINCCRITLLLIALDNNWRQMGSIDHHDMFNIVSYSCIFLMMYFYTRKPSSQASDLQIPITHNKSFANN
jgi:exosortase/archaeosortase family protein